MRVGWLIDEPSYIGGAERTQAELRAAAPDGVEIVDCPKGSVDLHCTVYAVHNVVTYSLKDLEAMRGHRIVKYWNDIGSWMDRRCRAFLDLHAEPVYCSPLQKDYMGAQSGGGLCIPPPVDVRRFDANGYHPRKGTVSVGSWRNLGKGSRQVARWAAENGVDVDFYGSGPFAPQGSHEIDYALMPQLLAKYERFVFLPMVIEPFGRSVAEAFFAGCEVVTNELVGAGYWIREKPEAIESAAGDYWSAVLA